MTTDVAEEEALAEIIATDLPLQNNDTGLGQMGAVRSAYIDSSMEGAWVAAWKFYLGRDENGELFEYGVPVPLPRGQLSMLLASRRPDGGKCFTLSPPKFTQPEPTIECFVGVCPKKLYTPLELVRHVRHAHREEADAAKKMLDQIETDAVEQDPRLQKVVEKMRSFKTTSMPVDENPVEQPAAAVLEDGPVIFRCQHCPRFFDTDQGMKMHAYREHKGASDGQSDN